MLIQLVIIQIVTFVIIVVVLKKLLYTETAKEADRLKKLRDEFFIKEKELQTRIEAARRDAEGKIIKAEEDARKYRETKEKEADKSKEEVVQKARNQAEEMVRAAVNSRVKIREEIELEIKKKIPAAAVRIFKEALPQAAVELIHNELVEEVVAKIKNMEKEMFKVKAQSAELLSPYPVKKVERERITFAISEKAGRDISLVEREDRSLVAGVVVKLETLVIDGSLENKLKAVEEKMG